MGSYNYTGKIIYIGIDVHKKTYACVSICNDKVIKKDTMPADPNKLISYIFNHYKGARIISGYEAGFSGFHLHRELLSAGIESKVIHPGSIEVASRDRVKTDKRDALKIATQLAAGRLNSIYIPSLEQESKRSVTRLRSNIVKLRHQVGQKLKALLFTQGLIDSTDDSILSKKWLLNSVAKVKQLDYPIGYYYTIKSYAQQWLYLTQDLANIKRDLIHMQTADEKKLLYVYKSIPGIGDISALTLKDELGDMSQFSNEKKLSSYLGFTPIEHSSGEHIRQGHISRQGRSKLRHLFIESAWIAIQKDPQLKEVYLRISKTRGAKRAIVAVARKLACRLRSCLASDSLYQIKTPIH